MALRRSFLACGCLAEACWSVIPQSGGFFSWLAGCFSWLALMGSLCLIFLCIVLVWLLQFLAGAWHVKAVTRSSAVMAITGCRPEAAAVVPEEVSDTSSQWSMLFGEDGSPVVRAQVTVGQE